VLVQNCVTGIMGVDAYAPEHFISTIPRLPAGIQWAELDSLKAGSQYIYLRHDRNYKTTLTDKSDQPLFWHACFYGNYSVIIHNGQPVTALQDVLNGREISYIPVTLQPGETHIAEADTTTFSVPGLELLPNVGIYPNPNEGLLRVSAGSPVKTIRVYNSKGALVKQLKAGTKTVVINVSGLESGIYILNIETGKETVSRKIILK